MQGNGIEVLDLTKCDDLGGELRERTGGRGPDSVIDAVGMVAHGSAGAQAAQAFIAAVPAGWVGRTLNEESLS